MCYCFKNLWKLECIPLSPIGNATHWNWHWPGTVKAVYGLLFGFCSICQQPTVRSMVVKMLQPFGFGWCIRWHLSWSTYLPVFEHSMHGSLGPAGHLNSFWGPQNWAVEFWSGRLDNAQFQPFGDMALDLLSVRLWNLKLFYMDRFFGPEVNVMHQSRCSAPIEFVLANSLVIFCRAHTGQGCWRAILRQLIWSSAQWVGGTTSLWQPSRNVNIAWLKIFDSKNRHHTVPSVLLPKSRSSGWGSSSRE